ncbi:MAG: hypothetical protein QME73_08635 [Bacillota bacterium]|nr:hypothetical protein [Bacillota bacterium]
MVKLIYQNEFAGGHLIANEINSLKRLQEECRTLRQRSEDREIPPGSVFEDIGNGLCRLHLAMLQWVDIDLATINRFFINTSNSVCGSIQNFEAKLEVFKQCCKNKLLPYPIDEVEAYLHDCQSQGYPPVRHSKIYRDSYSPAYRIVKAEYRDYFEAFCKIDALIKSKDIVLVAIDGNCGAGKSTLAGLLSAVYDCNVFHMDHFFLRPELKTEDRLKEVGGNIDYVRFQQEVVAGLQSRREFQYQIYDCTQMALGQYVSVLPKQLNIIEGVYSMHPSLISNYDLKIFLHIEEKEQRLRIQKRNGTFMQNRFFSEWIPLENQYFKEMKIREQSDLVFRR